MDLPWLGVCVCVVYWPVVNQGKYIISIDIIYHILYNITFLSILYIHYRL